MIAGQRPEEGMAGKKNGELLSLAEKSRFPGFS